MVIALLSTLLLVHTPLVAADREMGTFITRTNTPSDFLFFEKVELNQIEEVKKSLENGTDPNQEDRHHRTALHLAQTPEMVKLLTSFGANPNKNTNYWATPLYETNNDAIADALLNAGALPGKINRWGATALFQIAEMKNGATLVKKFIKAGAQVNHVSQDGDTALHCAVGYFFFGFLRTEESFSKYPRPQEVLFIIRTLIQEGASLTIKNNENKTPFDIANKKINHPFFWFFYCPENIKLINKALAILNPQPNERVVFCV